jgi:hypothetical protein
MAQLRLEDTYIFESDIMKNDLPGSPGVQTVKFVFFDESVYYFYLFFLQILMYLYSTLIIHGCNSP